MESNKDLSVPLLEEAKKFSMPSNQEERPTNLHMNNSNNSDLDEDPHEDSKSKINLFWRVFKTLVKYAVPSILSFMFLYLPLTINIIFVGNYGTASSTSSIGIGTLYVNVLGLVIGIGILGGLDTLGTQTFGAKEFYLLGLYAKISRLVICIYYLAIILPLCLLSPYILSLLNQDEQITQVAGFYIRCLLPALFFMLQYECSVRYLQSMKLFYPGMVISLITSVLHVFLCKLVYHYTSAEVETAAVALSITSLLNFLLIEAFIALARPCPEADYSCNFFKDENALSIRKIYDFMKLSLPSSIIFAADWIGFELLVLMTAYLGLIDLAANVCLYNFTMLLTTIPMGISYAISTEVGNKIASSKVYEAKLSSIVSIVFNLIVMLLAFFLIKNMNLNIYILYTKNSVVEDKFLSIFSVTLVFIVVNSIQIVLNGLVKGLGKQRPASIMVIMILYPINLPMAYSFAFVINYGLIGIWYAQITSAIMLCCSYLIMIVCLDWENISIRACINIKTISRVLKTKGSRIKQDYRE